jgi:hypothetical protein
MNDLIEVFLRNYYAVEEVPATESLADLLVRYLNENPDGLSGYTDRLLRLIADAEAA